MRRRFHLECGTGIKYWDKKRCGMVESSDTDKPARDGVCTTCGKAVGAAVSGSDGTWSFKPVCRCTSSKTEKADDQPKSDGSTKTDESSDEAIKPDLYKEDEHPEEKHLEQEQSENEHSEEKHREEEHKEEAKQPANELEPGDEHGVSEGEQNASNSKLDSTPASDQNTNASTEQKAEGKSVSDADSEPSDSDDSVFVKTASSSEVDSGGWASVTSAKTANGPDLSKRQKSSTTDSGSWKGAPSPKSFKDNLSSGDSHESWISLGSGDFSGEAAQAPAPPADDFSGPVPDDFNRPIAHEIGKMSSSGATSGGASSSGTNLGVSYSSGTNLSGASGAYRRGKGSSKTVEEPVDWVPVKAKPPEKSKSQFADDAELLDLTHKTETAEEKVAKPDTRKAIQDALRRNRIKTLIVAVIFLVLSYGVYQYASSKGLIKKLGILSQASNSNQQSKKGSGRHSKKNKRTK